MIENENEEAQARIVMLVDDCLKEVPRDPGTFSHLRVPRCRTADMDRRAVC